jgi:hypothetical protein
MAMATKRAMANENDCNDCNNDDNRDNSYDEDNSGNKEDNAAADDDDNDKDNGNDNKDEDGVAVGAGGFAGGGSVGGVNHGGIGGGSFGRWRVVGVAVVVVCCTTTAMHGVLNNHPKEGCLVKMAATEEAKQQATYYNCLTTRMEVTHQAGVSSHMPNLLAIKTMELSLADFDMLTVLEQKRIIGLVEKDYLAHLFLHNSIAKVHSQLKKDVANDYSKGNPEAYPANIHKTLTLMNEYKPLKLDAIAVPAQGTAFVTKCYGKGKKGAPKKYYYDTEWKALCSEAQVKIINEWKKAMGNDTTRTISLLQVPSQQRV